MADTGEEDLLVMIRGMVETGHTKREGSTTESETTDGIEGN
jgi:hypothetical protein